MSISFSAAASLIYFATYTIMMILLATFIWIKESHGLDKTFLKSVWIQRRIYAQVIIHFYDTATDIGVIITWFFLWQDSNDYKSVDMGVFFFCGCAVALLYRFVCFCLILYEELNEDNIKENEGLGYKERINYNNEWVMCCIYCRICIRLPLIILDLFIFEAVYESFKSSEKIIDENRRRTEIRQQRIQAKIKNKRAQKLWEKVENALVICLVTRFKGNAKETFESIANKNGFISFELFESAIRNYGFTDDQIQQCFWALDTNKSGKIDEEEFSKWYLAQITFKAEMIEKYNQEVDAKEAENTTLIHNDDDDIFNNIVIQLTKEEERELELEDIDPASIQYYCMLAEAVFESMPQVILQTVFLVRAINDPILRNNSNQTLVFTSLIASIVSVSNKFYLMDKLGVKDKAKSAKPKKQFPKCIEPWYSVRISWRFFHIFCRFAVFSLIWIVLGGYYFVFYLMISTFGLCCCCGWCCQNMIDNSGTYATKQQYQLLVLL
eukprot:385621_1